jgi:formylglycine-generating enzyme required for sulfatase activity
MVKRLVVVLLLIVVLAGLVRGQDAEEVEIGGDEEVEIEGAEELGSIKVNKIIWKKDGAKMIRVPERSEAQVYDEFGDSISGKFDAFYMDVFEVTVGQFKKFLKSSGYKPLKSIKWEDVYEHSPTDEHPMCYVNWYAAAAYAKWVGRRLPTEAEWRFAARGGLAGKRFPWGDDLDVAGDYANYVGADGEDNWDKAAPVGSLEPNGYGLFDMVGNVHEWSQDWYGSDKKNKVLCGGHWFDTLYYLRVGYRYGSDPIIEDSARGFRCVVDVP